MDDPDCKKEASEKPLSGADFLKAFAPYASQNLGSGDIPRYRVLLLNAATWVVIAVSIGVGLFVFGISAVLELWLYRHGASLLVMMISSDVVAGLFAGLLYYTTQHAFSRRRAMVIHRLEVIAAMNHCVRNELDLILLSVTLRQRESAQVIHECTSRITWALNEILGSEFKDK